MKYLLQRKSISSLVQSFLILFLLSGIFTSALAQESRYQKQVDALAKSFQDKSLDPLKTFISSELQFGPIPLANSPAILTNIINNFPKLNSLKIIETGEGQVLVKYDFEQLGTNQSSILFDGENKIKKIEYLEEIVMNEIRAQQALQNSVQAPTPGELGEKYPAKPITFPSKDGLLISANSYEIDAKAPVILLCHQAGYNKFEYAGIAPKLNEMGFNVLAIDQRSGGVFAEHQNETALRAQEKGNSEIKMIDAQQDIDAAIEYMANKYSQKVILWGSSYSSSLAILLANDNPKVKGVIAFSPGNYFGETRPKLENVIPTISQPFLLTSSKEEATQLSVLLKDVELKKNQSHFTPESDGFHGSRALWEGQKGAEEYWTAVSEFLHSLYPSLK